MVRRACDAMSLMQSYRETAYAESVALRAWARAGVPPRGRPIDRWDAYLRHQHRTEKEPS